MHEAKRHMLKYLCNMDALLKSLERQTPFPQSVDFSGRFASGVHVYTSTHACLVHTKSIRATLHALQHTADGMNQLA